MKCCECDKDAKYLRATQFSGDHYFCKDQKKDLAKKMVTKFGLK